MPIETFWVRVTVSSKYFQAFHWGTKYINEYIFQAGVSLLGTGIRNLVDGVEKILLDDEESEDEKELEEKFEINEAKYETDPKTYTHDPEDESFQKWKEEFEKTVESRKNKLTDILLAR